MTDIQSSYDIDIDYDAVLEEIDWDKVNDVLCDGIYNFERVKDQHDFQDDIVTWLDQENINNTNEAIEFLNSLERK